MAITIDTVDFLGVVLGTSIEGLFWSDCRGKEKKLLLTYSFLTFNCFVFQIQIVRLSALTVKMVTLEALTNDVTVLRVLL